MDRRGQMGQHQLEGVPGVGDAMQKQHGKAEGVSLFDILKLDLIVKLNGFDHECVLSRHLLSPPFIRSAPQETLQSARGADRYLLETRLAGSVFPLPWLPPHGSARVNFRRAHVTTRDSPAFA
jgi:hypothetical protein